MNNIEKESEIKQEEKLNGNRTGTNAETGGNTREELLTEEQPESAEETVDEPAENGDLAKQLDFYKDQLLRRAAEFENYKRRTENEISNITRFANEYLLSDILPVIDDLERSLTAGKEKSEGDSFYKGIELIYSKLMKILEQKGLKTIEALNKPFDVHYHEAMLTMPKEGVEPNTVIQELEKGYTLYDKVIRHTKVIVSAENNGG